MRCDRCGTDNAFDLRICTGCGAVLDEGPAPGSAPGGSAPGTQVQGDSTGGIIPYKNPPALIAYYLGLFSLLPVLGLPLGIAAVILGVVGFRKYRAIPQVKGQFHAWIGIGCGGICTLLWGAVLVLVLISAVR